MHNQLKSLFNCAFTEIAMLAMICTMIMINVSLQLSSEWTGIAVAASLGGGVLLVAWLVWATYVLATRRSIVEMPSKPRGVFDFWGAVLFGNWIALQCVESMACTEALYLPWVVFCGCVLFYVYFKNHSNE